MKRFAVLAGALTLALASGASADEQQDVVAGEVVVQYAPSATVKAKDRARDDARVTDTVRTLAGADQTRVVEVKGGVEKAVEQLNASGAVLYAEPNYVYHAFATPDDPRFAEQTDLPVIDAPEAWDIAGLGGFPDTGGAKVGIVDTGIDTDHEDLAGRAVDCGGVKSFGLGLPILAPGADPTIVDGKCEDDNEHGTHVAGTIAANTNNGVGIAGIAFNSPLSICKGLSGTGSGTLEMVANCITWLNQKGAPIISMSLGGTSDAATLRNAVQRATANGSLIIAASGNGGDATPNYPAAYPEAVSVGATDDNDQHASFSTFNADVEISAPGVQTLSTVPGSGYERFSGTSMATPHVAAVAALIKSANPSLSVDGLRAKLVASVDDLGPAGRDPEFGFGRVNAAKAVTP